MARGAMAPCTWPLLCFAPYLVSWKSPTTLSGFFFFFFPPRGTQICARSSETTVNNIFAFSFTNTSDALPLGKSVSDDISPVRVRCQLHLHAYLSTKHTHIRAVPHLSLISETISHHLVSV